MSARARLITAQIAIVSILVAIVYAIFLTPGDDGPLTGIEAPERQRPHVRVPAAKPKPQRGPEGGPPAPVIVPPTPPAAGISPPAPTQWQYGDSVAQLRTLVRAAEQ